MRERQQNKRFTVIWKKEDDEGVVLYHRVLTRKKVDQILSYLFQLGKKTL